ncbi:MAG TPA: DUF6538 domain-containing protein [Burkholderiaceae bacterium]|jgi:integrase
MAYQKNPSHLWANRTGLYHFKLGIPEALRKHFPADKAGKLKSHIVESLHTHSRAEAMRLKTPMLAKWMDEFRKLAGGVTTRTINPAQARIPAIRETAARLAEAGHDADEGATIGLMYAVEQVHEQIEREEGGQAAALALRKMTEPNALTLHEALALYLSTSTNTQQSRDSCKLAVTELLAFLKVADCFPEDVPDMKASAYVDMLNAGSLSKSVKKKRLSHLNQLWRNMRRRGWPASPWDGHITTEAQRTVNPTSGADGHEDDSEDSEDVRPFTDAEALKVLELAPPSDKRKRTYTRPLFRELYALGFITGMRLNELASLRPVDVTVLDKRWRLVSIPEAVAKTKAGIRKLPVCHPVAVAILDARLAAQPNPKARLFSECVVGGPDNKPSWHVSKAMSKERLDLKRLAFTSEVNFHSTRRSFATLMENSTVSDHIGQQRYMGHAIPTQMHAVYSGGAGVKKLQRIVEKLRYPEEVEEALTLAVR